MPNWQRLRGAFGDGFGPADFGERLRGASLRASLEANGLDASNARVGREDWANWKYATLLHGDPKAPNFFYNDYADDTDWSDPRTTSAAGLPAVGMIDFQWAGLGLGAVDVAYCLAAAADPSTLPLPLPAGRGGTGTYVKFYYECLVEGFVRFGVAADPQSARSVLPEGVFQRQFQWAFIDHARVVIADHWKTITPDALAAREGKMLFNACNKSLHVATWMVALADRCLDDVAAAEADPACTRAAWV